MQGIPEIIRRAQRTALFGAEGFYEPVGALETDYSPYLGYGEEPPGAKPLPITPEQIAHSVCENAGLFWDPIKKSCGEKPSEAPRNPLVDALPWLLAAGLGGLLIWKWKKG